MTLWTERQVINRDNERNVSLFGEAVKCQTRIRVPSIFRFRQERAESDVLTSGTRPPSAVRVGFTYDTCIR